MSEQSVSTDWWHSFHQIEMADLFLERPDEQLRSTTECLLRSLQLRDGDRVFDQCCGTGTLSLALARHGVEAIGVDLCESYIERGGDAATELELPCRFEIADAFDFVARPKCDAAFNWFSSFGYAISDRRNETMLRNAFESLKPGGRFAMDVPNFIALMRNFQRHMVRSGTSQGRAVTCIRESNLNLKTGMLEQNWQWLVDGRPEMSRASQLRIYLPHQIAEMLQSVGFENIQMYGGTENQELDTNSPRLVVTARRPE